MSEFAVSYGEQKPLPHDLDLEKMVLGSILMESDSINQVIGILTSDRIFYSERNRKVWNAIRLLFNEDKPIDSVTVFEKMKSIHKSHSQELALYIQQLGNFIGSAANIETHSLILKEMYIRRRVAEIGASSQQNALDETKDPFDVYEGVLTELNGLNNEINRAQYVSFGDAVREKSKQLKDAAKSGNYLTGIKTCIDELDRVTLGFQPTDLIIVAARPSMGKTALVIDIARKQSKNLQVPVAIFSLEMSQSQLTERILSAESKIELETIRKGGMKHHEWQTFDLSVENAQHYPIHICDKGGLTINEICSMSKNWKIKFDIKAIYIDYIQLLSNPAKEKSREQEISSISRRLKQLAKELQVPVIALSQLSRKCEERTDKRPMLSDLRESGAIEQDADVVIFLYRDDYYNDNAEKGLTELIIGKNRNGKVGKVECYFNSECQTFLNSAPNF